MASGYTVFTSYILIPEGISLGYGHSQAIHCNYINSQLLTTTNPYIFDIIMNFEDEADFKFLSNDIDNGTGYTANKIYGLVQLVNNSGFTSISEVKPTASDWKIIDLTTQITTHTSGNTLTASELAGQVFKIPLNSYSSYSTYNLHDFITYPTKESNADNQLCFGDEYFFMGNVSTQIKAIAYTTDISIVLSLNEFNSSTNETWTEDDIIAISEVGIYDENLNLVGIGKFNNPISKDSTIARTIVFAIDF